MGHVVSALADGTSGLRPQARNSRQQISARQPRAYQVAAPNGSIAEGADQTRKRNREAVRDGRWNAVPISNYRRLDE